MEKKTTIEELLKRIEELEKRPIYPICTQPHYPLLPSCPLPHYPQSPPYNQCQPPYYVNLDISN